MWPRRQGVRGEGMSRVGKFQERACQRKGSNVEEVSLDTKASRRLQQSTGGQEL